MTFTPDELAGLILVVLGVGILLGHAFGYARGKAAQRRLDAPPADKWERHQGF